MEPLSENSRDTLRETVFQLLAHNQSFDQLIKEISDKSNDTLDYGHVSDLCCLSLLKSQSLQLGTSSGYHGIDQCATLLSSVVKNSKGPLLSTTQRREVESIIATLQRLMSEGCLEKSRLHRALQQHDGIPLELLWLLDKGGIISIGTYLGKKCSNSGYITSFSSQMKQLICEDNQGDNAAHCLSGILTELLDLVYTDRKAKYSSTTVSAVNSILDKSVLDFVDLISDKPETMTLTFVKAFEKLEVGMETRKKATSLFLSLVLSYKPITKVSQALQLQGGWCYSKAPFLLISWYKQLLLPLATSEVLEKLQRILEQQEVNWQLLLTFVSTMIVCLSDARKTFLDFTDRLLQEGLENCDMESLITGLLLVRQACLHGPHVFMSYADWFQRSFSEGSRTLANNRKSFTFLIKFLTDIMPYESANHLKVHILRPPFVPPKCRDLLSDYILLAKTRLEDLQESLEIPGQEDSKASDESKNQEKLQYEVENAVSLFDSTGKIPSSVMEASIFKKPHYVGRFLPALLKPRPLPTVPDAQMKLIEALKKAEKIPPSMYTTYEKACRKETLQLTEGLFLDIESDDDMELTPFEQLTNSLNQLEETIQYRCGNEEKMPKFNVKEAISNVYEKIEAVLNISPDQRGANEQHFILDTDNLGISKDVLNVTDVVLNFICETVHTTYSARNVDFTWMSVLLTGMSQYSVLVKDLFKRIWSLIFSQPQTLENHHIDSLAVILVELQKPCNQFPWIQLSGRCSKCCQATRTFTEHVLEMIPVSDGEKMAFALRISSSYLKYVISTEDEANITAMVPPVVVKKYNPSWDSAFCGITSGAILLACVPQKGVPGLYGLRTLRSFAKQLMFTATRLLPEVRYLSINNTVNGNCGSDLFIVSMVRSPVFQNLLQTIKFTFCDWLNYEIRVNTENDALSDMERYEYHSWAVYQHFLRLSVEEGGFSKDFRLAASQVLGVVVKTDSRYKDKPVLCQKCKNVPASWSSSRNHLVSLLQELTRMFDCIQEPDNKLSWLPSQLITLCEMSTLDLQKQATVLAFLRVALCLPSHLMFCDKPSKSVTTMKEVANILNAYMVECLSEGVFLPLSWTLYIVQGLKLSTSEENFCSNLDDLCRHCPIVAVSINVHHKHLDNLLCNLKVVPMILNAVEYESIGTRLDPEKHWFQAASMFAKAYRNNFEEVSQSILQFTEMSTDLSFLLQLLLLHMTSLLIYGSKQVSIPDKIQTLIYEIWDSEMCLNVMFMLLEPGEAVSIPSQCTKKAVVKFQHIAVMRVILLIPPKTFADWHIGGFSNLLKLYTEVAQTFDRLSPDSKTFPGLQQLISLDEVLQFNRYVKEVIRGVPAHTLEAVPQELFVACGSDVVSLVQKLISRH